MCIRQKTFWKEGKSTVEVGQTFLNHDKLKTHYKSSRFYEERLSVLYFNHFNIILMHLQKLKYPVELQYRTKLNETRDILHKLCYYSLLGTLFCPLLPQNNNGSFVGYRDAWPSCAGKISIPILSIGGGRKLKGNSNIQHLSHEFCPGS